MYRLTSITFACFTAAIMALTGTHAYAQYNDAQPPQPTYLNQHNSTPTMPMMRNDIRLEHRRQGAKCMNAYPEDHGAFTNCIRSENAGSPYQPGRRHYMPMSPGNE